MQEAHRLAKLEPPGRGRTVSMVLDTDTFNEVDDQFAVAYAVRAAQAGELKLEAVYAAPFSNQMGTTPQLEMELSYQEILRSWTGSTVRSGGVWCTGAPVTKWTAVNCMLRRRYAT